MDDLASLIAKKESVVKRGQMIRAQQLELIRERELLEVAQKRILYRDSICRSLIGVRSFFGYSIVVLTLLFFLFIVTGGSIGLIFALVLEVPMWACSIAGALLGAMLGGCVCFFPSTKSIKELIKYFEEIKSQIEVKIMKLSESIRSAKHGLQSLSDELRIVRVEIASVERSFEFWLAQVREKNKKLLSQDWRSLRGVKFELWLVDLFRNLGGVVSTTRTSGDQGVDLLVQFSSQRIAIQAKGYPGSTVGNKAVQEAHTGAAYYQAAYYAVVTNSTFTRSAIDLANKVKCHLIDRDSMIRLANAEIEQMRGRNP